MRSIGKLKIHQHTYWQSLDQFLLEQDTYPHWSIFIIEKGKLGYRVLEESGTGEPGDFLLCPPGLPLKREALTSLDFHFFQFEWEEEHGEWLSGKFTIKDKERLQSNFNYLKRYAFEQDDHARRIKEHYLLDLFFLYSIEAEKGMMEPTSVPFQDRLIYKALLYIREHAFEQIALNQVAQEIGLSPVQFTRRFSRSTGMTPNDYVTSIRIRQAREMLLETDKTLDAIAKECGFNNGFYLSRVFKKRMKMSPAAYRKTHWI
ncbi:helix-turn-helix domain-containing protein [Metabacillus sp. 113a]|uniref:helix-turn-helix domain-containing protein n=1 Tax=Metabacillus sp. 113a TaxID=3404706 RepID=UPI003CF1BC65